MTQIILFSFAFNPETKELFFTSNIKPPGAQLPMALRILQDGLISKAIDQEPKPKTKKSKGGKKQ